MTLRLSQCAAWLACAFGVVAVLWPSSVEAQTSTYRIHRDTFHGLVTSDAGRPIAGAEIAITMAPDRTTAFATTDSAGRYSTSFERGTGDYLVHASALGFRSARKRVTRLVDDSVFTVDMVLQSAAQELAVVNVHARREKPKREQPVLFGPRIGTAEQMAGKGVNAMVGPDQRGDPLALAGTLPGVSSTPGGISVLGLPPAQNEVTLNGLSFGGGQVPRAALTTTEVTTSTYDATRGGFSGGQIQVTLAPSGPFKLERAYVTLDAPQLQAADAVARREGVPYTRLDFSVGRTGEVKYNRWFTNSAIEVTRRISDATSLLGANQDVLEHAGISADSVSRFLAALADLGVPATAPGVPSSIVTDGVTLLGRLDRPMFDYNTYTPLNTTWGVTGYANWTRSEAMNLQPTATPAHAGERQQLNAQLQGLYSAYLGARKDILSDTRSALTLHRTSSTPYLRLPDGRVLVGSSFADGASGVASLAFGGNGAMDATTTTATWETKNETSLYWGDRPTHPGKVHFESRFDAFRQDLSSNRLGSFAYNSLDDLRANRPAWFTRTLDSPVRTGGEWSGVAAAIDGWHPSERFWLLYGARVEGNAFTSAPAYNPQIQSLFGARTDHAPNTWAVSPRVGFTWVYTSARNTGEQASVSPLGEFYSPPRGALRGGIGEFRDRFDPALLSSAAVATGLQGGARQLACFGPAAPVPNWGAYETDAAAIPDQCAAGASAFANAAPGVQLFDRAYAPPTSWRGDLSWTSGWHGIAYTVDAIYSYNLHQSGMYDLNFAAQPQFTLSSEGDRPVYVNPSSIVPSTGVVSPFEARRSAEFAQVNEQRSDLHGWTRQLQVSVRPDIPSYGSRFVTSFWYTYTQAMRETRGFDGTTFGDPGAVSWARSEFAPSHEFTTELGFAGRWAAVTLYGKIRSGLPFTPVVAGDINGDGLTNDRAFIFDPGRTSDTVVARGLRSLIASSAANVRHCIQGQFQRAAARNSCIGPWAAQVNATLQPGSAVKKLLHLGARTNVSLYLANPLAGLDQLLHGNEPRGWGSPAYPSPYLYFVRGFDSAAKQFRYEVNPRFGDTRPSVTSFRAPFRVTLDISLTLGPSMDRQEVNRWLEPGRHGNPGPKLDSAALFTRYRSTVPDYYEYVLHFADSLLLSRDQVEELQTAHARYLQKMEEHWAATASYMASLPDDYDLTDVTRWQAESKDQAWEIARQDAHAVLAQILTPIQLKMLPWPASLLYNSAKPLRGMRFRG